MIDTGALAPVQMGTANGGGDAGYLTVPPSMGRRDCRSIMTMDPDTHGQCCNTAPHSSVVGEFNANFGNGTAAGAFGARQVADQVNGVRVRSMRT